MKLVFVCTGNTCRSPMAQAIFTDMAKDCGIDFTTGSAGLHAQNGMPASENAVLACGEIGLDLSGHSSKSIRNEDLTAVDLFVVMTMAHAQALMAMGVPNNKIYILNVSDPFGGNLQVYRDCRDEIRDRLIILLELIKRQKQGERYE